jgi:hypothetical protein
MKSGKGAVGPPQKPRWETTEFSKSCFVSCWGQFIQLNIYIKKIKKNWSIIYIITPSTLHTLFPLCFHHIKKKAKLIPSSLHFLKAKRLNMPLKSSSLLYMDEYFLDPVPFNKTKASGLRPKCNPLN